MDVLAILTETAKKPAWPLSGFSLYMDPDQRERNLREDMTRPKTCNRKMLPRTTAL